MIVGALVLPRLMRGMTEASATRRPSTPRTFSSGSTTASSCVPIAQVPTGWYSVWVQRLMNSCSDASSSPWCSRAPVMIEASGPWREMSMAWRTPASTAARSVGSA